jgi:hypothetical protein
MLQGDQVKAIEQTRVTNKKRTGVVQFIKFFPVYVSRIETQLVGADGYETRSMVDAAYEKLVQSMLECLKTMAKTEGDAEDKGQLNYHVILIGKYSDYMRAKKLSDGRREYVLFCSRIERAAAWCRAHLHPKG